MIYKTNTHSFDTLFQQAAEAMAPKLTFTTKDEYFAWVKQWKEDYQGLSYGIRLDKLEHKLQVSRLPDKIERLKKLVETFNPKIVHQLVDDIVRRRTNDFPAHSGQTYLHSRRDLAVYMLILRKAGRIRTGALRAERLARV